jgi:hypothetical protein
MGNLSVSNTKKISPKSTWTFVAELGSELILSSADIHGLRHLLRGLLLYPLSYTPTMTLRSPFPDSALTEIDQN